MLLVLLQDIRMGMPTNSMLHGRRILVTRPAEQAEQTATIIRKLGGQAVLFPCLEVQCLPEAIRRSSSLLTDFSIDIAFTSANGIRCVASALDPSELSLIGKHRLAAIGKKTGDAMAGCSWQTDIIADTASQEGLIEAYRNYTLPNHLLLFRAEEGRDSLPNWLQQQGTKVTVVHAYRTVCPTDDASAIVDALHKDAIDAVLLGSPKTAIFYLQRIGDPTLASRPILVAISPEVAKTAQKIGLGVQVVASNASFSSMLDALAQHYQAME